MVRTKFQENGFFSLKFNNNNSVGSLIWYVPWLQENIIKQNTNFTTCKNRINGRI